ncbi:ATP-binding cassette domain-containing protein [Ruminococcaceae bacterium OttesenSCG-928-A11]|nr:ATP-binding cassette domain-containing protein [Ruminococcaceae bacterium OttesenSCG-928-A11]
MIEVIGLLKSYGARTVLDIDALHVKAGARCAVIGPNGSGKTTLLRILAGALAPDSGEVHMPDFEEREVGFMPQRPYSFGFSVLKNVQMAFQDQKASREPALEALAKVGMEAFATARGNKLSGGEAQRMAVARMIARPRKLLLLDEPTSSTDIAGNERIEQVLDEYCRQTGCTLVFATHSPAQVQTLSEVTVMLDHGKVVECGPTTEVLFSPRHPVTQAFLKHWQLARPTAGTGAQHG